MGPESNDELIRAARSVLRPARVKGRLVGDVGAAVLGLSGAVYTGVAIDTAGWGLCAERSALASMVTAGELRVRRVAAVWERWEEDPRELFVLPPCGACRDFMVQLDEGNLDAEVVLGLRHMVPLRDLLPLAGWPESSVQLPD